MPGCDLMPVLNWHLAERSCILMKTQVFISNNTVNILGRTQILDTSNRIPTRRRVVMHTSCYGTIVITNLLFPTKCSSACYHGMWCHNNTNWHHNSSTMPTCNRKPTWLSDRDGQTWYGRFSNFLKKMKFQCIIFSKFNIAISVVNGPFLFSMCWRPMASHYPNHWWLSCLQHPCYLRYWE